MGPVERMVRRHLPRNNVEQIKVTKISKPRRAIFSNGYIRTLLALAMKLDFLFLFLIISPRILSMVKS